VKVEGGLVWRVSEVGLKPISGPAGERPVFL